MILTHKYVSKSWGAEEWIINTSAYCGKKIIVIDTWSSQGKYHYHMVKDETFHVVKGALLLDVKGDRVYRMNEGDSLRIKPLTRHRFKASGPLCEFIEFSTHHEDSDSYYENHPEQELNGE